MTSSEMGTSSDNEFEHWPLDVVPDPIEPNGIALSHETPSRITSFTQKHPKLQESAVSNQKHPKVPASDHFSWADDANTLPISATATTKHPRDLSGLRSSSKNPFSSLQRRRRQSRNPRHFTYSHHQYNHYQPFPTFPHRLSSHNLRHPSQPHTPTSLDWEDDPRLSELSCFVYILFYVLFRNNTIISFKKFYCFAVSFATHQYCLAHSFFLQFLWLQFSLVSISGRRGRHHV